MAENKPVTKKKVAKNRPSTKSDAKTNVKNSPSVESSQAESGVKRNVVSWVALLCSGLAVGGVVWYLTAVGNIGQQETRFNQQFNTIAQRVDEFDATQSDYNNVIGQLQNQLAQMQDDFSSQIETIQNEFQNKLIEQKSVAEQGRDTDSRTLEQAEQLILMAKQQVQFGGQFVGGRNLAKRALQDADALLQKRADSAINQQVRQLLSVEMTALDKVKVVDIVGVLNTLSALSSTVENLALAGDIIIAEKTSAETTVDSAPDQPVSAQPEAEVSDMRRYVQPIIDAGASFLSSMGDLIQVEKNGKSVKPIISAQIRQMIYQRTKLMLESAQIAFIRQQPDLYRNQIQLASRWVKENFDQELDETTQWLARLDAVGLISPQSKLPDIDGSLKAIRNIIKNKNQESVGIDPNKSE